MTTRWLSEKCVSQGQIKNPISNKCKKKKLNKKNTENPIFFSYQVKSRLYQRYLTTQQNRKILNSGIAF